MLVRKNMNILYQADDNYATMLGVSLTSLLENNKASEEINVYIIDGGISTDNRNKIDKTIEKYNRQVRYIKVDELDALLEAMGAKKYRGSYMTFYKLYVRELLPKDIDKILYIDCDTCVGNIESIFDIDISDYQLAMAQDLFLYDYKKKFGYAKDEPIYLAGVILFNYGYWEKNGYDKKLDDFINKVDMQEMDKHEQDILNLAFRGNIYELPMRYNMVSVVKAASLDSYYAVYKKVMLIPKETMAVELENACIYHFLQFVGKMPCHKGNIHPYNEMYHNYKRMSLWKDDEDTEKSESLMIFMERIAYYILPRRLFLYIFKLAHDITKEV